VNHDLRDRIAAGMQERPDRYRFFVTCFCSDPSLLSMWRAYANRGGGYCLGFDSSELRNLEQPSEDRRQRFNWLFQMVYGEPEISFKDSLRELAGRIEQDPARPLGFAVARILAGKIKHESFKEEREWRIIVDDPTFEEMHFRQGHSTIIPYIDLRRQPEGEERLLPLRRVVCGPTLRNDDELLETVKWMLAKHGYDRVVVERCGIPYRP